MYQLAGLKRNPLCSQYLCLHYPKFSQISDKQIDLLFSTRSEQIGETYLLNFFVLQVKILKKFFFITKLSPTWGPRLLVIVKLLIEAKTKRSIHQKFYVYQFFVEDAVSISDRCNDGVPYLSLSAAAFDGKNKIKIMLQNSFLLFFRVYRQLRKIFSFFF